MLNLKKIAITGTISSGKSTVCNIFHELGAFVVSADEIAHQLLSFQPNIEKRVIKLLGKGFLAGKTLDRSLLADLVFSDPEKLELLESIIHPAVFEEIEKWYQIAKQQNAPLFVAEIPLYYEAKNRPAFDAVIAVLASSESCRKRFQKNKPFAHYSLRMKRQLSSREKAKQADIIIRNNGTLQELRQKTTDIFYNLIGREN